MAISIEEVSILIGKERFLPRNDYFDASTRDYCTVERQKTSTPLQSLILLNDPQVQNAAEAIASLILKSEIKKDKERIIEIHRRITGRKPTKKALSEMMDYLDKVGELHSEKMGE